MSRARGPAHRAPTRARLVPVSIVAAAALVAGCFGHHLGYAVGVVNESGEDLLLHVWGRDGFVLTGPTTYLVPGDGELHAPPYVEVVQIGLDDPDDGRVLITTAACEPLLDLVVRPIDYVVTVPVEGDAVVIEGSAASRALEGPLDVPTPIETACALH